MSYKVLRSCTAIINFFVVYKNAVYKENLSCRCFCYHLTLNVNLLSHENWSLTVSFFSISQFQNEEQWQVLCRNRQRPSICCCWSVHCEYHWRRKLSRYRQCMIFSGYESWDFIFFLKTSQNHLKYAYKGREDFNAPGRLCTRVRVSVGI